MTLLLYIAGCAAIPVLLCASFAAGQYFERDRWIDAVLELDHVSGDADEFRTEMRDRVRRVQKGGWSNAY